MRATVSFIITLAAAFNVAVAETYIKTTVYANGECSDQSIISISYIPVPLTTETSAHCASIQTDCLADSNGFSWSKEACVHDMVLPERRFLVTKLFATGLNGTTDPQCAAHAAVHVTEADGTCVPKAPGVYGRITCDANTGRGVRLLECADPLCRNCVDAGDATDAELDVQSQAPQGLPCQFTARASCEAGGVVTLSAPTSGASVTKRAPAPVSMVGLLIALSSSLLLA